MESAGLLRLPVAELATPYAALVTAGMAVLATACWLVFVKRNTSRPSEADGRKLPPGSRGFPIIGETLEFLTESPANQLPAFFKRRLDRKLIIQEGM